MTSFGAHPAHPRWWSLPIVYGPRVGVDSQENVGAAESCERANGGAWSTRPYFSQLDELERSPVLINIQLRFDRKRKAVDGLCLSQSPLLSVHADVSTCVAKNMHRITHRMVELVFAPPCSPAAGATTN